MSVRMDNPRRSAVAAGIYAVFNPVPFGCFVAALLFDVVYANSGTILWDKAAAWLIVFGLLFAIVPRLINLSTVWITSRRVASTADKLDFWLNLFGIATAIANAFVHSRDAYAVVPAGVWLSAVTVLLHAMGRLAVAVQRANSGSYAHE